jgi:hypothetical protein
MLFGLGISTGRLLNEVNVILPQEYLVSCLGAIVLLWLAYPVKNAKGLYNASYARRKFFDLSLGMVTFLMMMYTGNSSKYSVITQGAQATFVVPKLNDSALTNHPHA